MPRRLPGSEPELSDLEPALAIDENALEEALLAQPDCFYQTAKRLALETSRRDAAKQALAEAEAEADSKVRHDAAVADEKVTETEIRSQVRLDRRVKEATEVLHHCNLAVGQFSALKEAFTQRSYVLKDLVGLYVAGYFGDVSNMSSQNQQKTVDSKMARHRMNEARRGSDAKQ